MVPNFSEKTFGYLFVTVTATVYPNYVLVISRRYFTNLVALMPSSCDPVGLQRSP